MTALLLTAYASSAVRLLTEQELLALLEASRAANARAEITGMLLYSGGNFLQVLEGPEEAVRATMARIAADARHKDFTPLVEERIDERQFPGWAMGFERADRLDSAVHPGLTYYLQDPALVGAREGATHEAVEFLRVFRELIR